MHEIMMVGCGIEEGQGSESDVRAWKRIGGINAAEGLSKEPEKRDPLLLSSNRWKCAMSLSAFDFVRL
jgi:hypothetical protein